jgi:hypothetical protein
MVRRRSLTFQTLGFENRGCAAFYHLRSVLLSTVCYLRLLSTGMTQDPAGCAAFVGSHTAATPLHLH